MNQYVCLQDMQFWVEIFIERIFEIVRSFIYYSLSPFKTAKLFLKFLLFSDSNPEPDDLVETSTLGDSNPALQKQVKQKQTLNTDGRTCEDVITSLGCVDPSTCAL